MSCGSHCEPHDIPRNANHMTCCAIENVMGLAFRGPHDVPREKVRGPYDTPREKNREPHDTPREKVRGPHDDPRELFHVVRMRKVSCGSQLRTTWMFAHAKVGGGIRENPKKN